MKFRLSIVLCLLALVVLSACKSTPPPEATAEPTASEVQSEPVETEPAAEVYPAPEQVEAVPEAPQIAPGQALYPEPQSGDAVTWAQAVAMMNNSEISQILRSDGMELTLTLKDGRSLVTNEPEEGGLQIALDRCGDVCTAIEIAGP